MIQWAFAILFLGVLVLAGCVAVLALAMRFA